jgi:hypothetical protein
MLKSETICGITIILEAGTRYYASRPFVMEGEKVDVSIVRDRTLGPEVLVIPDLDKEKANQFLTEFNAKNPLEGRIWGTEVLKD